MILLEITRAFSIRQAPAGLRPHAMTKTPVTPQEAPPLSHQNRQSFAGAPSPYRISGPLRLVRLMQNGRAREGEFWFEERVFNRLRQRAMRDLTRQSAANGQPFASSLQVLLGLYMKHCLRSDLAISKNWTSNFDSYVVLALSPQDSVVGWVGRIANQPYYSPPNPADPDYAKKKEIYDLAESAGVSLLAAETQYVIDFKFPANQSRLHLLQEPRPF
jgi:hypothetical protein